MVITSYGPGGFGFDGTFYSGSWIISPNTLHPWIPPAALTLDLSVDAILLQNHEVVIVGTGEKTAFPLSVQRIAWKKQGWKVEWMDTGAACRTYNLLLAEGRKVIAALVVLPYA